MNQQYIDQLDTLGKKYRIYAEVLEDAALEQFVQVMAHDAIVQGALMPDAHKGYGLPIGGVVASRDVIFPSFVGYDIGCGMCAVPTSFNREQVESNKKAIFDQIYRDVPTGFSHNEKEVDWTYDGEISVVGRGILNEGGRRQLGTLGGGNHFIEIGNDESNRVWIVIHSGSRNVGHRIATHYMKAAAGDGKAREGNYGLAASSDDGKGYIADLAFGLAFALENRLTMVRRIEKSIQRHVAGDVDFGSLINRNHNHAELNAEGLWVHRKGATHAELGMFGVIPGNMRDGSFVVRGRGNPDSLCSSSHGAGRVMGRKEAERTLDLEVFKAEMAERGIQALVGESTLDESAGAYKNIFEVMALQKDLVDVLHHVRPLINIKGAGKEC